MDMNLVVKTEIEIFAKKEDVWKAILTPELVKEYFFGVTVHSDWKQGSNIIFSGSWEGKTFKDKGIIQEIVSGRKLEYLYYSAFSGLEDRKENYSLVSYELIEKDNSTLLKLEQTGFASKQAHEHSLSGWTSVLAGMKKLVESI